MSNRPLTITITNQINNPQVQATFRDISTQHGEPLKIIQGNNPLQPNASDVLYTTNSNDFAPGPQGTFSYTLPDGSVFEFSYTHPLGMGSTLVPCTPPSGYTYTMTQNNLAHQEASCVIVLSRRA